MNGTLDFVFLLWHVDNDGDEKLIGAYCSEEDAKMAIRRLSAKPGFVLAPEGFHYDKYEINRDHWTEGFVRS